MGLVIAMASNVLTEKDRKEIKLQLRPVVKRMLDEQCVATAIANVMRRNPDLTGRSSPECSAKSWAACQ